MRFHILGLPHTQTTREYSACAFTQKVRLLSKMLHDRGHEVIHCGVEGSDPECSENVVVVPYDLWAKLHKSYDWKTQGFVINRENAVYWKFVENAAAEIKKRRQPGDFLLCTFGLDHKPIADELPGMIAVESGIGYEHTFAKHRVFESYAWMHAHYGKEGKLLESSLYDAVIPNYFDLADYPFQAEKGDYFIFVGRPTPLKGLHIADAVCREIGAKLYVAGQGVLPAGIQATHLGVLSIEGRAKWVGGARALFAPTLYIEPFGTVTIEAGLYGTPVITTDAGAFTENVIHGKTGFRCRTHEQFVFAAKNIHTIQPEYCRAFTETNFSLERVGAMYEEYFQGLVALYDAREGKGWYSANPARTNLDWLRKEY